MKEEMGGNERRNERRNSQSAMMSVADLDL